MQVSVVIPTFNRQDLCIRAVKSVLAQSYQDFELIVVDDGSASVPRELMELVLDSNHKFVRREENRGVSAARNFGVSIASGKWIAFLDSDDEWLEHKLARQVEAIGINPSYRLSHCEERWYRNGRFVNPKFRHAKAREDAFSRSLELCCISPSSVLLSRDLLEERGGFDENLRVCEDYDLWLRVTAKEPVLYIEEPLVKKYGGHDDQLSSSEPAMDRFRIYVLLKLLRFAELSRAQRVETLGVLAEKARIVASGAKKRGLRERWQLFSDISSYSTRNDEYTDRDLDDFLCRAKNEIIVIDPIREYEGDVCFQSSLNN